ncbi:hypothetical protein [uncultured Mediterranean phage uvDeep-CGR0-KM22-C158]|nr:hypothetical protein [uncultured Mediterranean phage uvDeep-CGR0-KM15-C219]ANS02903.1 hypothetical protein [uncultured Mediterranean phage uvDeep-CGR0-KM22-C158]
MAKEPSILADLMLMRATPDHITCLDRTSTRAEGDFSVTMKCVLNDASGATSVVRIMKYSIFGGKHG